MKFCGVRNFVEYEILLGMKFYGVKNLFIIKVLNF